MKSKAILRLLIAFGGKSIPHLNVQKSPEILHEGGSDFQHKIHTADSGTGLIQPWDSPIL